MGEIRKIIGENIKRVSMLKGIKQIQIAEYLNVSQGTVSNWFKGLNSIDIEHLADLCSFLNVSLDQIFGFEPLSPAILSTNEEELIKVFRSLSSEGQEKTLEYMDDLLHSGKYIKSDSSQMVHRQG